jgi:hypothetical protein
MTGSIILDRVQVSREGGKGYIRMVYICNQFDS